MSQRRLNVLSRDFFPAYVVWELTLKCDLACTHCGSRAGPRRPERWMTEFGDPRRPDVDVVDWIETIPFAETRTYVMRVAESLPIYRARLTGQTGPIRFLEELKGR